MRALDAATGVAHALGMFVCSLIALLPFAAAPQELAPAPAELRAVAEGEHFRVVCHFDDERAAAQALAAAERVWPHAVELLGAQRHELRDKREVHLYRELAEYEAADERLTRGTFRRNQAFSSHEERSSHVMVQPPVSDAVLAELGLPTQTLRQVAHEAAHLASYETLASYRFHPHWFAEGFSCFVEQRVAEELGISAGVELDPIPSTFLVILRRLDAAGRLPSADELLADAGAALGFDEGYALAWGLFRTLQDGGRRRAKLVALAKELGRLPGDAGLAAALHERALERFGERELERVDADLLEWIRSSDPRWEQPWRNLDTSGEPWLQSAFGGARALAWAQGAPLATPFAVGGEFELLDGVGDQCNVHLELPGGGWLMVAFKRSFGVSLFEHVPSRAEADQWRLVGEVASERTAAEGPVPFRVEVDQRALRVLVGGEHVLAAEMEQDWLPPRRWGLGCQKRTAVRWRDVGPRE